MAVSRGTRGQAGTCRASSGAGTQNSDTAIPLLSRSQEPRKDISNFYPFSGGLPGWLSGKDPPANAGDAGSAPWSERSPGEGNGNPLKNSCLENPMDRGTLTATVHGVTEESGTTEWLNNCQVTGQRLWAEAGVQNWARDTPSHVTSRLLSHVSVCLRWLLISCYLPVEAVPFTALSTTVLELSLDIRCLTIMLDGTNSPLRRTVTGR